MADINARYVTTATVAGIYRIMLKRIAKKANRETQ